MTDSSVKRGDIFYAGLSPVVGSEQGGIRPGKLGFLPISASPAPL